MNITLFLVRIAVRKKTLLLVELDGVEVEKVDKGKVKITFNIAKLKNMQPKLRRINEGMFHNTYVTHVTCGAGGGGLGGQDCYLSGTGETRVMVAGNFAWLLPIFDAVPKFVAEACTTLIC